MQKHLVCKYAPGLSCVPARGSQQCLGCYQRDKETN